MAMSSLSSIFNNREIAAGIWIFLFLVWALRSVEPRAAFSKVLRAFFVKPIIISVVGMLLYIALTLAAFHKIGLWDVSSLKETIFWCFGVAFVMLMNINDVHQDEHYFRKVMLDSLKLVLVLEFIINFYVFNLGVELVLLPVLSNYSKGL
jgi:hypothetical protein